MPKNLYSVIRDYEFAKSDYDKAHKTMYEKKAEFEKAEDELRTQLRILGYDTSVEHSNKVYQINQNQIDVRELKSSIMINISEKEKEDNLPDDKLPDGESGPVSPNPEEGF